MNHCRDCNSDYATPGTCNCFAVGGKRSGVTPVYVPYTPYVQPNPYHPPTTTPWWGGTITVGDIPSGTVTGGVGVVAGSCARVSFTAAGGNC